MQLNPNYLVQKSSPLPDSKGRPSRMIICILEAAEACRLLPSLRRGQLGTHLHSVQFSHSVMSNSLRPHGLRHARPPCLSPAPGVYPNSSIESVMPSRHLILCRPLLLPPPVPPSTRVFSNESTLHIRWPKYWSFSFNTSFPMNTQD